MKEYFDFNPVERIRINLYLESIFKFGFLTLCYLIDKYEKVEDYRECELIFHALQHHQSCYTHSTPTRYSPEAIQALKDECAIFGLDGTTIIANIPHYAEKVEEHVEYYTEDLKTKRKRKRI